MMAALVSSSAASCSSRVALRRRSALAVSAATVWAERLAARRCSPWPRMPKTAALIADPGEAAVAAIEPQAPAPAQTEAERKAEADKPRKKGWWSLGR